MCANGGVRAIFRGDLGIEMERVGVFVSSKFGLAGLFSIGFESLRVGIMLAKYERLLDCEYLQRLSGSASFRVLYPRPLIRATRMP